MKKIQLVSLSAALWLLCGCTSDGVQTFRDKTSAGLENEAVRLTFDLQTGTYSVYDKAAGVEALYEACGRVNDWTTQEADELRTGFLKAKGGKTLRITSQKAGCPELFFDYTLLPGVDYVLMHAGVRNTTDSLVRVHTYSPLSGGRLFRGKYLREGFRLVDGQGGGATTDMYTRPQLASRNNLILHFGNDREHHSLVGGGVSYWEFDKFARLEAPPARAEQLAAEPPFGLKLAAYCDLGGENPAENPSGPRIRPLNGEATIFDLSTAYPEAKSVLRGNAELAINLENLDKNKPYALGLSWCDDSRSRWQSVYFDCGGERICVLPSTRLPSLNTNRSPEVVWFDLPEKALRGGELKVVLTRDKSMNAVLSEAILLEGKLPSGVAARPAPVETPEPDFDALRLDLYATDPVGKRIDPGEEYIFEKDGFYLGAATPNPLEAAEQYARTLRQEQKIELNYYYFPTICMWYAMEPKYGGTTRLGTNDSPGAVAEMDRVVESGWLRYTTMGIRLVPDCYEDNNQNGWWDDRHWQMHGSGRQVEEMNLEGGHYRTPYETSEKWCWAIRERGGLPFMYSQTAVRSEDYAEAFPQHMLFNEAYHEIPQYDWLNKTYSTYDFTDTSFASHMREVYQNLNKATLAGMMFDYPYLGWPLYGGMDDPYATTAGAYRRIFELAREGMPESYLHERNIKYGSDITLGLVSSQRTWGDTDVLVPEMVRLSGLRWYKNRVVVSYDMDGKNLPKARPTDSPDGLRKLLTMSYVAASRLLLANSFGVLTPDQVHTLSRIFPYHQSPQSARPLDAFTADYPRVYGFKVDEGWQALTFYNEDDLAAKTVGISLSGTEGRGGAGMDPAKSYYAYDFWNDRLVGTFQGSDRLEQTLRPGEARQIALREKLEHPQVLSTDRHLMQGYLELSDIAWQASEKSLSGTADLVAGEPMTITLALNGHVLSGVDSDAPWAEFSEVPTGLVRLRLSAPEGGAVQWKVRFE